MDDDPHQLENALAAGRLGGLHRALCVSAGLVALEFGSADSGKQFY
jgi:hypothetical protein